MNRQDAKTAKEEPDEFWGQSFHARRSNAVKRFRAISIFWWRSWRLGGSLRSVSLRRHDENDTECSTLIRVHGSLCARDTAQTAVHASASASEL